MRKIIIGIFLLLSLKSFSQQDSTKGSVPILMPGMAGILKANPTPVGYNLGHLLRTAYITGIASGIAQWQSTVLPGAHQTITDVSNAHIFIQKTEGVIQYFLQLGGYAIPDIGVSYSPSTTAVKELYGLFPQGFLKIAPTKNFSIQAGKLSTLIGAEYTFSFENMNIQRGLLWNEENAVNRGVQVNYTAGPVSLSVSWNDGFYSQRYTWAWLSASYTINNANMLSFTVGGNTKHTDISSSATPLNQNNQQIYGLMYTHTSGKWTIEPYFQYTHIPKIPEIGDKQEASTSGAALYVHYSIKDNPDSSSFNLPLRLEYIRSSGSADKGAPNLLYGPGSKAWSVTITPTYQYRRFFLRPEFSLVKAYDILRGVAFGPDGNNLTQIRLLVEVGIFF